jgi:hypothetical protein
VPQRAALAAHQRGSEVIIEFPFPTTTISGTPLLGVSRIEVWRFGMEVPEFAVEILIEEDARREEAQDLLDELGLDLYETPSTMSPEGGVADPFAVGTTTTGVEASGSGAPTTPDATASPPLGATPANEVAQTADTGEDAEIEGEAAPSEGEEPAGQPGADDAEGSADDASDTDGESESGEETEGEEGEPVLTEEEELALRIEAARNLLRSPPTPKSSFIAATAKDFNRDAELVLTVETDDIPGVVVGDRIVLRVPLPPRVDEGPEIGYLFGAKVFSLNGKPSDLSNTVALLPEDVPAAPRDVTVEAQAEGVLINWATDEEPKGGFRIYRRDAQSRTYGDAIAVLPGPFYTYFDRQAIFGARYIYGITTVASTTPLLESDISSEHEVDYQDRFGPAVPGGLVAFPEAGRVRLLWTPVANPDLAGYAIRRRASLEDEPQELTDELVTRSQYLDETVSTGQTWFYTVVAVDLLDNRSEPGAEIQVRVP